MLQAEWLSADPCKDAELILPDEKTACSGMMYKLSSGAKREGEERRLARPSWGAATQNYLLSSSHTPPYLFLWLSLCSTTPHPSHVGVPQPMCSLSKWSSEMQRTRKLRRRRCDDHVPTVPWVKVPPVVLTAFLLAWTWTHNGGKQSGGSRIFGFWLPASYTGCHKLEGGFVKGKAETAAVKDSKVHGFLGWTGSVWSKERAA